MFHSNSHFPFGIAVQFNNKHTVPSPHHTAAIFSLHSSLLLTLPYSQSLTRHTSSICPSVTSRIYRAMSIFLSFITQHETSLQPQISPLLPLKLYLAFFLVTARRRLTLFPQNLFKFSLGSLYLNYSFSLEILYTRIFAWGYKAGS